MPIWSCARATGVPQTQIEKLKARINEVEQDALADGFQPVTDKHGKRIGIGQPMPVATDMIEDVLGEGKMYCILSAVTHGHSYAIRGLNYVPVEQPGQGSYGDVPVKTFQKCVNIAGIALLGLCAARALARPLWNQCHYFGWNALRLEELLENVCDKIGDKPEHRFWRS